MVGHLGGITPESYEWGQGCPQHSTPQPVSMALFPTGISLDPAASPFLWPTWERELWERSSHVLTAEGAVWDSRLLRGQVWSWPAGRPSF